MEIVILICHSFSVAGSSPSPGLGRHSHSRNATLVSADAAARAALTEPRCLFPVDHENGFPSQLPARGRGREVNRLEMFC